MPKIIKRTAYEWDEELHIGIGSWTDFGRAAVEVFPDIQKETLLTVHEFLSISLWNVSQLPRHMDRYKQCLKYGYLDRGSKIIPVELVLFNAWIWSVMLHIDPEDWDELPKLFPNISIHDKLMTCKEFLLTDFTRINCKGPDASLCKLFGCKPIKTHKMKLRSS